jgi:hypothetical protein
MLNYTPPNLELTSKGAVPWSLIITEVEALARQYGPLAGPYVDAFIESLTFLPAWAVPFLDNIVNNILGYVPAPPPVTLA